MNFKYISHRGNINGFNKYENHPQLVMEIISKDFDVEIDVWHINNEWHLGHDSPIYRITEDFLETDGLWCHAKNLDALYKMISNNKIHCFYHNKDDYTLTSKNYIWTSPNKNLSTSSIAVLPELWDQPNNFKFNCGGVCSDYIKKYV